VTELVKFGQLRLELWFKL